MDNQKVEAQYRQVETIIRHEGLAVVTGAGGDGLAPVAFSIGAAAQDIPDLIVYGLPSAVSAPVINNAMGLVKAHWPFPSLTRFRGIVENHEVALRDVSRSDLLDRIMFLTKVYNERNALKQTPLLQICWPDALGAMPFEPACNPTIARMQRIASLR